MQLNIRSGNGHAQHDEGEFVPVSPFMMFGARGAFALYIDRGGRMVLFADAGEPLTQEHKNRLLQNRIDRLYIRRDRLGAFNEHVRRRLSFILSDPRIPIKDRSGILYNTSVSIVREVFEQRLPEGLRKREFARIADLARKSTAFLSNDASLQQLAALIGHDYGIYTHSVQVFVYAAAILRAMDANKETIVQVGVGALLHDIGKERIDAEILLKPGPLTQEERRVINTHPVKGLALCAGMPLTPVSMSCILMHHERMDGSGYPGNLEKDQIPLHVRAVTAADIYDALTSDRPYAAPLSPFEALTLMREDMRDALDMDVFKHLVKILSGAHIV